MVQFLKVCKGVMFPIFYLIDLMICGLYSLLYKKINLKNTNSILYNIHPILFKILVTEENSKDTRIRWTKMKTVNNREYDDDIRNILT